MKCHQGFLFFTFNLKSHLERVIRRNINQQMLLLRKENIPIATLRFACRECESLNVEFVDGSQLFHHSMKKSQQEIGLI